MRPKTKQRNWICLIRNRRLRQQHSSSTHSSSAVHRPQLENRCMVLLCKKHVANPLPFWRMRLWVRCLQVLPLMLCMEPAIMRISQGNGCSKRKRNSYSRVRMIKLLLQAPVGYTRMIDRRSKKLLDPKESGPSKIRVAYSVTPILFPNSTRKILCLKTSPLKEVQTSRRSSSRGQKIRILLSEWTLCRM